MKRHLLGSIAIAAVCAATPSLAADYPDYGGLRPAYPQNFETGDDSLRFETGVRYWYSIGEHKMSIRPQYQIIETKTNSGEAFVRIDDDHTRSYVEVTGGYGIAHEGKVSSNGGANLELPAARLGYAGADFGWLPLGNEQAGLGFVVGYQYTNDSPDTGRSSYTTAETVSDITWSEDTGVWSVGADSHINNFDVHALKLGLAGRIDAGAFDITGEAAATPYSWVSGRYGGLATGPQGPFAGGPVGPSRTPLQASETTIEGHAYGASGKLMVGFHPTENLTIRIGGRASYLQGQYDATYDLASIADPTRNPDTIDPDTGVITPADPRYDAPTITKERFITDNNPFSMFRYGALLEVAGRF